MTYCDKSEKGDGNRSERRYWARICKKLAAQGYELAAVARNELRLEDLMQDLGGDSTPIDLQTYPLKKA